MDDHAPPRRTAWRVTGVPPGLAVLVLLVAVAGVLLLGRGQGEEEVLVGPAGVVGPGPEGEAGATEAASQGAPGPDGVPGGGVVGDVVPGVPPSTAGPGSTVTTGPAPPAGTAGPGAAPLLVHVDGAVQRPGVVELPPGARVGDAVQAAGGATDEADTRLVNLARPLTDGELVVVPRPGEQVAAPGAVGAAPGAASPGDGAAGDGAPGAGTPGAGAPAGAAGPGASTSGGLVDVNTADAATLDELPGIGPVLAERIVAWREESGPFAAVDDLTAVSGIGPAVLSDIRDLVTV